MLTAQPGTLDRRTGRQSGLQPALRIPHLPALQKLGRWVRWQMVGLAHGRTAGGGRTGGQNGMHAGGRAGSLAGPGQGQSSMILYGPTLGPAAASC